MSIKLIALDMDNTLLNRQKLVSPKNKEAIYKAMQNGVHVTMRLVECQLQLVILLKILA